MLPTRQLGNTGFHVTIFGLGGEGVLRTTNRQQEAQAVIKKAFECGINYFDTAPAYQQSRDYLGTVFETLSKKQRENIFIASKTHDRSYSGSMEILDDTLKRLKTKYLDLWQLHDLRTKDELEQIFSPDGAINALAEAQKQGRVRFIGVTGHHDPEILITAMKKHKFDTVLLCANAGDAHYLPFISTVIPEARKHKMGIIAMKVLSRGYVLSKLKAKEAVSYALSQDIDLCIVGCNAPAEVEENVQIAQTFKKLNAQELRSIEEKTRDIDEEINFFKKRNELKLV